MKPLVKPLVVVLLLLFVAVGEAPAVTASSGPWVCRGPYETAQSVAVGSCICDCGYADGYGRLFNTDTRYVPRIETQQWVCTNTWTLNGWVPVCRYETYVGCTQCPSEPQSGGLLRRWFGKGRSR